MVTDTQWRVFCAAFGREDLVQDAALATNVQRVHARERLIPVVADICRRYTKAELMQRLEVNGLPFAPITKPEELFDDPHLQASSGLGEITLLDGRKTHVPMLPLALDGERLPVRRDVPRFAEHTHALLARLGYSESEIAALREQGLIATPAH